MRINPEAFKAIRELGGHSQFSLASESGVSQSRISEIEAGDSDVRPATAKKLAASMKVPVVALLADACEPEQAA